MVPVSTQISIVNPETNRLCLAGEYGEIWVQSEANAHSFYGSKDAFDAERFNGRTVDGDPEVRYVRTGDLGFLHTVSRPIGPGGNMVEMQVLFVLGGVGETFEVNGLQHFPQDVETSVERCHRAVVRGGCAIFQAGSLLVLVAEVRTRAYLASLVPVIVNAVLNEHQLVLDIVAFVAMGDFPRSRLGEKQRGKILAGWVSRKMRTIAQFSIRDPDAEGSVGTAVPEEAFARRGSGQSGRAGASSIKRGMGAAGSSLRNVESITHMQMQMPVVEEPPLREGQQIDLSQFGHLRQGSTASYAINDDARDITPTNETPRPLNTSLDYSPIEPQPFGSPEKLTASQPSENEYNMQATYSPAEQYDPYAPKAEPQQQQQQQSNNTGTYLNYSPIEYTGSTGGLKVANPTSDDEDDWGSDALRHMNLGR
ncbi:AMP-binding protein [Hortaea werneckii]|nr:AMP-binding protein [Hortaea werneckii]